MLHSWLTPCASVRPAGAKGSGIFAHSRIAGGDNVAGFGGFVTTRSEFEQLPINQQVHSLQIAENLFMTCPSDSDPADLFNHSCDPNCGISGNVLLVAMRDIEVGEELTFDYAMCDADDYDEFECECGTVGCRDKVTGNDWMIPELQNRYRGMFSTYLEHRITNLRAQTNSTLL